jgi:hypothetical protein
MATKLRLWILIIVLILLNSIISTAYDGPVVTESSDLVSKTIRIDDEVDYRENPSSRLSEPAVHDKHIKCPEGTLRINHGLTVEGHNYNSPQEYVYEESVHWRFRGERTSGETILKGTLFIECRDSRILKIKDSPEFVDAFSLMVSDKYEGFEDAQFRNKIINSAVKLGSFGTEILNLGSLSRLLVAVYKEEEKRLLGDSEVISADADLTNLKSVISTLGNIHDGEAFVFLARKVRDKEVPIELKNLMKIALAKHSPYGASVLETSDVASFCLNGDRDTGIYDHAYPVIDNENIHFTFKTREDLANPTILVAFNDGEGGPIEPEVMEVTGEKEKDVKITIRRKGYTNYETGTEREIDLRDGYRISLNFEPGSVGYGGEVGASEGIPFVGPEICTKDIGMDKLDFTYFPDEPAPTFFAKAQSSIEERSFVLRPSVTDPSMYVLGMPVFIVPEDCIDCAGSNSIRVSDNDNIIVSVEGEVISVIETKTSSDWILDMKDLLAGNLDFIKSKLFPIGLLNTVINAIGGDTSTTKDDTINHLVGGRN